MSMTQKKDERHKLNQEIGARCKQARIAAGYTQEQLAESIDTSTQFLSDAERGVTGMSLSTIMKLCTTLSVSSDFILFGHDLDITPEPLLLETRLTHLTDAQRALVEKQVNLLLQAFNINRDI